MTEILPQNKPLDKMREELNERVNDDMMDAEEAGFLYGYELDAYEHMEGVEL